ncbi:efflux RND transporter periplasmic adaptor subunit [Thalassoroseus pseudoceratinae]|uniref:efflux RND transporter periplasmic adaptor subunit n=1 Tax=Thalassoroseus pseudoceratinae TaxID=2713176 RepID=UPI001420D5AE|nr:HlyD family efflux transporter periplasmic adaptor subunit [Thalassoroseus pseudoceratinae]
MTSSVQKPLRRWPRISISVILMVFVFFTGVAAFVGLASLNKPPVVDDSARIKRYNVEVYDVSTTRLRELIVSYGTAEADREVTLSAEVAGRIINAEHLERGWHVYPKPETPQSPGDSQPPEGTQILTIDPEAYEQRVAQVAAQVREAQAEIKRLQQEQKNNLRMLQKVEDDYKTATAEYRRIQNMRSSGVATPSELTKALLDLRRYEDAIVKEENEKNLYPIRIETAETRLATLKADYRIAERDLEHTIIVPPFAGVISEVMVEKGQYVRIGDPLVRLTDVSVVEIPVPLKLADYTKIEQLLSNGVQPQVELAQNLQDDVTWTGRLVRRSPEADAQTRTLMVYVEVDNAEQAVPLLPGTFVYARIEGPVLDDATVLPREGIVGNSIFVTVRPESGGTDDSSFAFREIPLGPHEKLQTVAIVNRSIFQDLPKTDQNPIQVILTNLDVLQDPDKTYDAIRVDVQSHTNLEELLNASSVPVVRPMAE